MGNGLKNAGGLDGNLNWNANGGGVISVDEASVGGPGRGAFLLAGTVQVAQGVSINSDAIGISGGQLVEAYGYTRSADNLHVDFLDSASNTLQSTLLTRARAGAGSAARRGLLYSFDYAYARILAPGNATQARIGAGVNVGLGAPYLVALTKPYLATAPSTGRSTVWDPGSHSNPDLQLPTWPSKLPPFQADALPEPISNMTGYATDANIDVTRDLYSGPLQQTFRGHMRLDYDQADTLESFYEANRSSFFVVRPDTDQLCVARWLKDGQPKPTSSMGPWTIYEVGLRLAVA